MDLLATKAGETDEVVDIRSLRQCMHHIYPLSTADHAERHAPLFHMSFLRISYWRKKRSCTSFARVTTAPSTRAHRGGVLRLRL